MSPRPNGNGEPCRAPRSSEKLTTHVNDKSDSANGRENPESPPQAQPNGNGADRATLVSFEATLVKSTGGGLVGKRFWKEDGKIRKETLGGIYAGRMKRVRMDLAGLAKLLDHMPAEQALVAAPMAADLPDEAPFCAKRWLDEQRLAAGVVSRSKAYLAYREGEPALTYLDHDPKDLTPEVVARIEEIGGYDAALALLDPALAEMGYTHRPSTSAGIYDEETGERLPDGSHRFCVAMDGTDVRRYFKTLLERGWLHGLSYYALSKSGAFLERCIIDISVAGGERLIFESDPIVEPPLKQPSRVTRVRPGGMLDTNALADLSPAEAARVKQIKAAARKALSKEEEKAQETFVTERAERIVEHDPTVSRDRARHTAARQREHVLLPSAILHFDNPKLGTRSVAEVMVEPLRYVGEPLADPNEGVEYGRTTAIVYRDARGMPWVFSFAHGRTIYRIRADADYIKAAMKSVEKENLKKWFVPLVADAEMDNTDQKALVQDVSEILGGGKVRELTADLKAERERLNEEAAEARRERVAESIQRPQLRLPLADEAVSETLIAIDDILSNIDAPEPPMRDVNGAPTDVVERRPIGDLHALTSAGANAEEEASARMEPPPQLLLTAQDVYSGGLALERHMAFIKKTQDGAYEARLHDHLVRHYLKYRDSKMPVVSGVQGLPLVLPNGELLSQNGLHRRYGLVMRCDPALLRLMPQREDCDDDAVREAMSLLLDDWFCDVPAAHADKCALIAYGLSVIERLLFPARPVFTVTAPQRAVGKTTVLLMITMALLGATPPASAWADNEEERKKALFAYMLQGLQTIVWDNIKNGGKLASDTMNVLCTSTTYSDRVLGVSEFRVAPAYTIHCFTGNNVEPCGDLASRTLEARLAVGRVDPQNRRVKRRDPVAWTFQNRARILKALYVVLLGNPRLSEPWDATPSAEADEPKSGVKDTRFKVWHRIVGAAVEHGSELYCGETQTPVSFAALFDTTDAENSDHLDAMKIIKLLHEKWPTGEWFTAGDVSAWLNDCAHGAGSAADWRRSMAVRNGSVTAQIVGEALAALRDKPVELAVGGGEESRERIQLTLIRRTYEGARQYRVARIEPWAQLS
jgi:hypothetical protein